MERLRFELWLLLPLHFVASAIVLARAQGSADGERAAVLAPLLVSIVLWLGYPLTLMLSGVLRLESLQMHDPLEQTTALHGAKWRLMGAHQPARGPEVVNEALASALAAGNLEFTQAELASFGLHALHAACFIRVGGERYREVGTGVRYDDVPRVLGYAVERYCGLAATRHEETADAIEERAFRSGLAGLNAKYTALRRLAGSMQPGVESDADAPIEPFAFANALDGVGAVEEIVHGVTSTVVEVSEAAWDGLRRLALWTVSGGAASSPDSPKRRSPVGKGRSHGTAAPLVKSASAPELEA